MLFLPNEFNAYINLDLSLSNHPKSNNWVMCYCSKYFFFFTSWKVSIGNSKIYFLIIKKISWKIILFKTGFQLYLVPYVCPIPKYYCFRNSVQFLPSPKVYIVAMWPKKSMYCFTNCQSTACPTTRMLRILLLQNWRAILIIFFSMKLSTAFLSLVSVSHTNLSLSFQFFVQKKKIVSIHN